MNQFVKNEAPRVIMFNQTAVNTSVVSGPYGNVIRHRFSYPQKFENCELALNSLFLYFSWFNIQASFGNNVFQYSFPVSNSGANTNLSFTVTVPDGNYDFDTLNEYFQTIMVQNGTYLLDSYGNPVYYAGLTFNATAYRASMQFTAVPSALPSGYTLPSNFPGSLPTMPITPSITIPATSILPGACYRSQYSFALFSGFTPGTYPSTSQSSSIDINGGYVPSFQTTNCVNVGCSIVNNSTLSDFPQVLYSFSPLGSFGDQLIERPTVPLYVPISNIMIDTIDITLLDDNGQPLNIQDPHVSGSLLVRQRS